MIKVGKSMEEFEKQLLDVFNASLIPLEAKLYVMKHVYSLAENEYKRLLRQKESEVEVDVEEEHLRSGNE